MTLKMKRSCSSALVAILTACLDSIALAWSLCNTKPPKNRSSTHPPKKKENRNRNRNQSNASPAAGRRRGDPPSVGRRPPRWRPAATPPPPRPPPPTPSLPNKARTFETRPRPLEDVKLPSPSSYPLHHLSFYEFPLFLFLSYSLLSLGFNGLFIQSHGVPLLTA